MMKITKDAHDRGVFWVFNTETGNTYRVDTLENRPTGWCSCEDYHGRQNRRIRESRTSAKKPGAIHRCKHLAALAESIYQKVVDAFEKDGENPKRLKGPPQGVERVQQGEEGLP